MTALLGSLTFESEKSITVWIEGGIVYARCAEAVSTMSVTIGTDESGAFVLQAPVGLAAADILTRLYATDDGVRIPAETIKGFRFLGSHSNETIDATESPVPVSLYGCSGDDHLTGSSHNDFICGHAGFDELRGRGGNDSVFGGSHRDVIQGGGHNDLLVGGDGNDRIDGQGAMDFIYGQEGNDSISCGDGWDIAFGGSGNDTIHGEDGPDHLNGGPGFDRLKGDDDDDILVDNDIETDSKNDRKTELLGGPGQDRFYSINATTVIVGGVDADATLRVNGNVQSRDSEEGHRYPLDPGAIWNRLRDPATGKGLDWNQFKDLRRHYDD